MGLRKKIMKFGESEQEDKDYKRITQSVYKDINEEPGEGGFLEEVNLGKSSSYRSVGAKVYLKLKQRLRLVFRMRLKK